MKFEQVYPFTTEEIAKYFPKLNLSGKSILTVGSSADQAFNALLHGAKNVVIYDINPYTYEFYKLKKNIILNSSREEAYKKVLNINNIPFCSDIFSFNDLTSMNTYFNNDENYEKLQDILSLNDIEFVNGDIFDFKMGDSKFDRIIFSNAVKGIDNYAKEIGYEGKEYQLLRKYFLEWISHLNDEGILQLLYYYGYGMFYLTDTKKPSCTMNLPKVCETLNGYDLYLETFSGYKDQGQDAIITYRK